MRLLAVALEEIDRLLLALDHPDQTVGQVLLGLRHDPFDPPFVVEHDRAVRLHVILARQHRLLVDVDVLDRDLARQIGILAEPVLIPREVQLAGEHEDPDRRREVVEHPSGLVRQGILLRRRQVPPHVPPREDVVERHDDHEHEHDAGARQSAIACLPSLERPRHQAPVASAVQQDARQTRERQHPPELFQVRAGEPDRDRSENQDRTKPAEQAEESIQHRVSVRR